MYHVIRIDIESPSSESPSKQASHVRAILPRLYRCELSTCDRSLWTAQVTCQLMRHNWISMCKAHYSPLSIRSLHDRQKKRPKETMERISRKNRPKENDRKEIPIIVRQPDKIKQRKQMELLRRLVWILIIRD